MREAGDFTHNSFPLHTIESQRYTVFSRVFTLVYTCAILALLYHHSLTLLNCTTLTSFSLQLSLLLSDTILAFMWATAQLLRINPITRRVYPENLSKVLNACDYPSLDVFICTADPHKEPPMRVVNTALSVMAFEYPMEKVSVYVSDDGGSELTLFALTEAAKFARFWLPFCREKGIVERCPEAYFRSNHCLLLSETTEKIKTMYESMKAKVERVIEKGHVGDEYITSDQEREVFKKWTAGFTRQDHPPVIQILVECSKDKGMPNLVYVSREKSKTSPNHFKAGALNALLRVSSIMTNAPVILTLDCDMYSNDPQTTLRMLCYLSDVLENSSELAYVQFQQHFYGINKHDIYGGEMKRLLHIIPIGLDGLVGPTYDGTGCFFRRRAFYGGPSLPLSAEIPELNPEHVIDKSIQDGVVLELAHHVVSCKYEHGTNWGSKMGFRYGSLVEDYYTGYWMHCEGWKSVFCNPDRPAFLGEAPINLIDALIQSKRWTVGLLEVVFSKYSPVTYGISSIGLLAALCYVNYACYFIWCIPITIYGFIPPLALLNQVSIFPKVSDPWFYLRSFLFLGGYGQDFLDFAGVGGTIQQWWNDQRMWSILGLSAFLFGVIDFLLKRLGIAPFGFEVTSKVLEDEQSKRYKQGMFEFGVASPMFISLVLTAIINLTAFVVGLTNVLSQGNFEEMFVQLFMSGFVAMNCWPVFEGIGLRTDRGKMPTKITMISTFLAWALYSAASLVLKP